VNSFISIRCRVWFNLIALFGLTTGCALNSTVAPLSKTVGLPTIAMEVREGFQWPDNELPVRFQQYWSHRKAGDAAGSFEYEAPHVREMVIWGKYEGLCRHVRKDWSLIRAERISKITDQLVTVDFNMLAESKEKEGVQREIFFRDSWLFFSGQWFHVLKDPFVTGDGLGK
jgi:hypothetical protein